MFMSSSRDEFTLLSQNSVTDVFVGFRSPCWCPSGWTPTWRLHTKPNTKIWEDRHFSEYLARVRTLWSSPNSMTFHRFFHDLFKFCMTYGLAVTLKNFQTPPSLRVFLTLNSSTDTNSGVHKNACRTRYSITPLCLTLPLLLSSEVSREVTTQNFDFPRLLRTDL